VGGVIHPAALHVQERVASLLPTAFRSCAATPVCSSARGTGESSPAAAQALGSMAQHEPATGQTEGISGGICVVICASCCCLCSLQQAPGRPQLCGGHRLLLYFGFCMILAAYRLFMLACAGEEGFMSLCCRLLAVCDHDLAILLLPLLLLTLISCRFMALLM